MSPDSGRERDGDTDDVANLLPAARRTAVDLTTFGEPLARDQLVASFPVPVTASTAPEAPPVAVAGRV